MTVIHNVNFTLEQWSAEPPIRLLMPTEPLMDLLEPHMQDGWDYIENHPHRALKGLSPNEYARLTMEPAAESL